ncbi:STM4015 family protein [Nocardia alni]|uniref:STM4015 family protein n=1 Tax=Nocardia alni TaxID=2815723 RepID=UPI001C2166F6|nr:STM4015 family protein [Nocardia alni]
MTRIDGNLEEFYGLPTYDFPPPPGEEEVMPVLPEADSVAWRVGIESWDAQESWPACFERFLEAVDTEKVGAIVVGCWADESDGESGEVIRAFVAARDRLPALRAIFLGDIVSEENEISWICQSGVSPLLEAFPLLEEFGVRGGQYLEFAPIEHEHLLQLTVQAGGLSAHTVQGIAACEFPALTHLDLWLGTSEYGGTCTVSDLAPILAGDKLPGLVDLALRNSEIQDEICAALASAPVVARLEVLDVSMGVLTDEGAAALLAGQPLTHLMSLDMHYNYLSEAMCERLEEALEPAGVELDLDPDDAQDNRDADGEVFRFVAVGE